MAHILDEPDYGSAQFILPRKDLAPHAIRAIQEQLNDAAAALGIGKFIVLPFGAKVIGLADPPVLKLPAGMAGEGAYRVARLGAGFTEVFPGLEAAIFLPPDDEGRITAHFRLTPKDGKEHG